MASAGICYKLFSKISSLSPRNRFAIHPDQLGRKKKTKTRKDGGHEEGCASPNSISQKFSTVSHQAQGALWVRGTSSPGTPRQCLEQSCQPLPLEKAFQVRVFGLQRSKREGYFGSGLVLLLLSSPCLLLLLHGFDLSALPLPSCLCFGGEM